MRPPDEKKARAIEATGREDQEKLRRHDSTVLAAEINAEHERAFGKAREAIEHARRAGELLLQAKATVSHGEWLPWIEANCTFSERTARGYMRLSSHWNELQAKTATVADLPLRDALALLSDPKLSAEEAPHPPGGIQSAPDPGQYLKVQAWLEIHRLAPGVIFTPVSMQLPEDLPFENWRRIMSLLPILAPFAELDPRRRAA